MNKKCVLPENIIILGDKTFILPPFNPSRFVSNKQDSLPVQNSKLYEDEIMSKVSTGKLNIQSQSYNEKKNIHNVNKKNEDYTHFISIPLIDIQDKIYALQEELQYHCNDSLDEHYQDSSKTHLTLFMLSLRNKDEKKLASRIMEESAKEIKTILSETNLSIKCLGFFENKSRYTDRNRKKKASILYAKLEENSAFSGLEKLLDFLVKKFIKNGLLKEEQLSYIYLDKRSNTYKTEDFHITILRARNEIGFEVEKMIEKMGSFNLGNCKIKTVDLSTRFEYNEDGYYKPLYQINLNK